MFQSFLSLMNNFVANKKVVNQNNHSDEASKSTEAMHQQIKNNPYLQSRMLWQDVYGEIDRRLRHSHGLNLGLLLLVVILTIGFIIFAKQRQIQPYPFMIQGNQILNTSLIDDSTMKTLQPALVNMLAQNFIRNARSVTTDRQVNQQRQMAAMAMVSQQAVQVLQDFFKQNPIDEVAMKQVNRIVVTSLLPASNETLTIRWQEIWRDVKTGKVLEKKSYLVDIHYQFHQPSNHPLVLKHNPLGFYITQLSWSLEKINE